MTETTKDLDIEIYDAVAPLTGLDVLVNMIIENYNLENDLDDLMLHIRNSIEESRKNAQALIDKCQSKELEGRC